MKRTNDQVNNNNYDGGEIDINKKVKLVDGERNIAREQPIIKADPMGTDYNGMAMVNSPFGVGGQMMMTGAIGEAKRTIYLGGITKDMHARDIFDLVNTGTVESLRILPEKGCAFLCFVEPVSAELFHQNAMQRRLQIHGVEIKVGWGKSSPLNTTMQQAIQMGACRNVFIDRLDSGMDADYLTSTLSIFGEIEMVKILPEKNIAFVYFTSISSAINCVNSLLKDPTWQGRRISYGRDRCITQWKQQQQQQLQLQLQIQQNQQLNGGQFLFGLGNYGGQAQVGNNASGMPYSPKMDRTIYIGNLQATDTCEDLCSAIRGGLLYSIRHMREKCTAFVTFVDPYSATLLHAHGNTVGLAVNNRRVKIGWGNPTSIPFATLMAIQNGATRNIYLGNVEQPIPAEQLQRDFSKYGELEMIKYIPDKKCHFINFTNINSAMQARKDIPLDPSYRHFKINYGKDPCAKPFTMKDAKLQKLQLRQQGGGQQSNQQKEKEGEKQQQDQKEKEKRQQPPVHADFALPLK